MSRTTYVWLPVRCCCHGERILGFLKLRTGQAVEGRTLVTDQPHYSSVLSAMAHPSVQETVKRWPVTIKEFAGIEQRELAVYSEDRPVEYWRDVPGFVEAMPGDFEGR